MGSPMMKGRKPHVLLLPYPAQGHVNPMFQFGKRLAFHGLRVTIAITRFIAKSTPLPSPTATSVDVELISDGHDAGGFAEAESIQSYLDHFKSSGSKTLKEAILRNPVDCVVYDAFLPWALDVTKEFGVVGAAFFTQTCTVSAIYYDVSRTGTSMPFSEPRVSIGGLAEVLELKDVPTFMVETGPYAAYLAMVLNQFSNLEEAHVVLFNTVHGFEAEVAHWFAKTYPAKTIGPSIPSAYLDKRIEGDKQYGFDLFPTEELQCMSWLSSKKPKSVVYVSFGSMAKLGKEQVHELALGLQSSNKPFLWVVKDSDACELPNKFLEEMEETGLVVGWSPQLEVLAHPAVGCFVTHCGWNSTLEGLSFGMPLVGIPQWADQPTNAKLVEDTWKVGISAKADAKGVVRREEVASCIREVMEGERGEDIRRNAAKWKEVAIEAVSEGGSSDLSIQELIAIIRKDDTY